MTCATEVDLMKCILTWAGGHSYSSTQQNEGQVLSASSQVSESQNVLCHDKRIPKILHVWNQNILTYDAPTRILMC